MRGTDNAAEMTKSAIPAASALVLGLALAPTARAATVTVTFDGVDQDATSISPQSALGISGYPHTVVVDGVGADWTPGGLSFGSAIVGNAGTAFLSILNGGTVHATGGGVGDNGGDGNTALSGAAQHARVDAHVLGIYGSKALPNEMQLDFQADIGRSHIDGSREIDFGGSNRTARSSYATYSAHVGMGLSKDIALTGRTTLTPDVRADYTQLRGRGYSESGADALNLNVDASTIRAFVLSVGGRVRHALTNHSWLSANLGAGYDTINDRGNLVSVYAVAPGQSTTGIDHSPWLVNTGVGYTYAANSGMQVVLR